MSQNFEKNIHEKNWRDIRQGILQDLENTHLPLNPLRHFLFPLHIHQGKVYLSMLHPLNHPSPVFTNLPFLKNKYGVPIVAQ